MTDKPNSTELINMAHREWKNRQKRKGHDDAVPWTSGWISGYLTGKGTLSDELKKERERVLIPLLNQCKIEELNNKKRCDAGVDNISAFQLRARQAAFERCAIWIEESLRGEP